MSSVSGPSFGNVRVDESGTPRLSSKVLGIDPAVLIDQLVAVKRIPVNKKNVEISKNTAKAAAYSELETIIKAFNDAVANLRRPTIVQKGTDVFARKFASAQSSSATPAESLVAVFPTAKATVQDFTLEINRIARADRINSSVTFASATATPLTSAGTLTVNGVDISLNASDSVQAIANKINAQSANANVRAEVVNIGGGNVRLNLIATKTGDAITLADSAGALADLGLAASGETDSSLSAELIYNGVTLERSSNSITDLVPNTTIELRAAQAGTQINVKVLEDSSAIKTALTEFVDVYNQYRDFLDTQRKVDSDGNVAANAVLFGDSFLNNVNSRIRDLLAQAVPGIDASAGQPNNLRDIGIRLNDKNRLEINNSVLDDAILANPNQIAAIFGKNTTSTNPAITGLSIPNNLGSNFFTTVTVGDRTYQAPKDIVVRVLETDADGRVLQAEIDFDSVTYTAEISGSIMRGPAGSPLEGFIFGYEGGVVNAGDPAVTATIQATQGIADQMATYFDDLLSIGGAFASAARDFAEKEVRINDQIETLEFQVEQYRARLQAQFLAVEQQYAQLQVIQNSLISLFARNDK